MTTITQDMRYRLSLIKYAEKHGVTKAAIKYKTNRQYIYRWKRRYDGSIAGLYRFLKRLGMMAVHPPNPKYVPKPYEQMDHPGQRIQVDVKFVPSVCLVNSRVA